MKKNLIKLTFLIAIVMLVILGFSTKAQASTSYNSEISYNDNYNGTVTVVAAGKNIETATIPSYINGKKVTKIDDFNDCTHLTKVTIPSTVETIEYGAFENCTSLKSITIPGSVTSIEGSAFQNCSALTSITIPSSVKYVKSYAFQDCKSLKTVTIQNGLTEIPDRMFYGCTSLTSIQIPSSVKTIQWGSFTNCTSLTNITIPATVTELIGGAFSEGIFEGCTSLKSANINAKATGIAKRMFSGCTSLTNVTFASNSTIKTIGSRAFENCKSLVSITLPDNAQEMEYNAFAGCKKLQTVNIGDFLETIGTEAFLNCTSLTTMKFPCGVKTIDGDNSESSYSSGAFAGCTNLRNLYFTKSIQTIKKSVFKDVNKSQLTFYGYSGTAAKYYAQENGIKYVECTPVTSIKITGSTQVLKGSKITLGKTVSPSNAYNKNVRWTISDYNIATIDQNGVVTGKQAGTVTVAATSRDGTVIKATYQVKVILTELPFTDVTVNNWYYSAVKDMYNKKYMSGTSTKTFSPESKVTRGMIVTMLHNMEKSPYVSDASKFSDVQNPKDYYYMAVKWAAKNKIVSGYSNGKFAPNDPITREQLAVILNQYCNYKGKYKASTANLSSFKDSSKISNYAKWGMNWAVGNKIINGSNGKLNPQGTATRAEAAAMLSNYCKSIK